MTVAAVPRPQWFVELYNRLVHEHVFGTLPGESRERPSGLSDTELTRLMNFASLCALSSVPEDRSLAYEAATRAVELYAPRLPGLVHVVDVLLSRLGNFPGRDLLRERYRAQDPAAGRLGVALSLERAVREIENRSDDEDKSAPLLTDFQVDLLHRMDTQTRCSVSAPTSAGKSFVFALDLVRRLRRSPGCIVYVVPTRALIRQVSLDVRRKLAATQLDVPVRTVPFPFKPDEVPLGCVYVLTQERLTSLLYSREGNQPIATLVVDEAQSVGDDARGVVLQAAIETVRQRYPDASIYFASPLLKNPEVLLEMVGDPNPEHVLTDGVSPVSQDVILVDEVEGDAHAVACRLQTAAATIALGERQIAFPFRGVAKKRASFARSITKADECTIIYADGRKIAEKLALEIAREEAAASPNQNAQPPRGVRDIVDYVKSEIHPQYALVEVLPLGVGFHYGNMPSIIRGRIEDLFKRRQLKYLCCTSTLLQGVNLPAKHIVLERPKQGREPMERRAFLNLAGRAGRLQKEFHGFVWCLGTGTWKEESWTGDRLQPVQTAVDVVMSDGGLLIQRAIADTLLPTDDRDHADAVLGQLFVQLAWGRLKPERWRTSENAAALQTTVSMLTALQGRVSLPTELLEANRSVRPDRLQYLHDFLTGQEDLSAWKPTRQSMSRIMELLQKTLGDPAERRNVFYRILASQWMEGGSLREIIASRIKWLVANRPEEAEDVGDVIRDVLKCLETGVRFQLVKFYIAYLSVFVQVVSERRFDIDPEKIEPFHVYLECGTSNSVVLNLIALGLSRSTALALRQRVEFPPDATPEECMGILAATDLAGLGPRLCRLEVEELLSKREPVEED